MQKLLNEALKIIFRSLTKHWKHSEEASTAVQGIFFLL
jgi:hypothetical protein